MYKKRKWEKSTTRRIAKKSFRREEKQNKNREKRKRASASISFVVGAMIPSTRHPSKRMGAEGKERVQVREPSVLCRGLFFQTCRTGSSSGGRFSNVHLHPFLAHFRSFETWGHELRAWFSALRSSSRLPVNVPQFPTGGSHSVGRFGRFRGRPSLPVPANFTRWSATRLTLRLETSMEALPAVFASVKPGASCIQTLWNRS